MAPSGSPSLLDLPPELRIMVYKYVLRTEESITFRGQMWTFGNETYRRNMYQKVLGGQTIPGVTLLLTCRTINCEASEFLYNQTNFRFVEEEERTGSWTDLVFSFVQWAEIIGSHNQQYLRNVHILISGMPATHSMSTLPGHVPQHGFDAIDLVTLQWKISMCTFVFVSIHKDSAGNTFERTENLNALFQAVCQSELKKYQKNRMIRSLVMADDGQSGYADFRFVQPYIRWRYNFRRINETIEEFPPRQRPTLFDLPSTALQRIYQLVLGPPRDILLTNTADWLQPSRLRAPAEIGKTNPSHMIACKRMYQEAREIYINFNTFTLHQHVEEYSSTYKYFTWMKDWICQFGLALVRLKILIEQPDSYIDTSYSHAIRFEGKTLDLNEIISLHRHIPQVAITFRVIGSSCIYENTFSLQKVYASVRKVLAKRLCRLKNDDALHFFSFRCDGYGDVRHILWGPLRHTCTDPKLLQAAMDVLDYPEEPCNPNRHYYVTEREVTRVSTAVAIRNDFLGVAGVGAYDDEEDDHGNDDYSEGVSDIDFFSAAGTLP